MRSLFSLAFLVFATVVAAASTAGHRLLVVLDDVEEKALYSTFLADLTDRGFDITYETPKSDQLALFRLGERNYDHILLLPLKVKGLGPNLTPNILLDFINANGNILLTMSSTHTVPTSLVALLAELDITLPAERTGTVVDHFYYDTISAPESHDVLVLDAPQNVRPGLKPFFELPGKVLLVPHAVGHTLGSGALLTPILRAPASAYSYNPKEQADGVDPDDLFAAGRELKLVSTLQARNSARFTVIGSAEMLQDKRLEAKVSRLNDKVAKPANREFAKAISGWTFQELGVLRINDVEHRLQGDDEINPSIYRVKTDVSYTISVSEYVWDKWVPFTVPEGDAFQLEFSMLSPFHRLDLAPITTTDSATVFGASFTLPDQHGIFNFKINYKRPFLTYIEEKKTVSVRHMAHDEWPRSYAISGAWPWISGIGATVTGFVAFSALWMYSKPVQGPAGTKKTQ